MNVFYVGGYSSHLNICGYYPDGTVKILDSVEIVNATYLCFSPDRKYLYAVIERENGGVASFKAEGSGYLRYINEVSAEGAHPCHLSVNENGDVLYVANYSSGSTVVFDLSPKGIGAVKKIIDHKDLGTASLAVPNRQEMPHAHFVQSIKDEFWVCDLGLDVVFLFDNQNRELCRYQMPPGFGPRHMAFHQELSRAYVVGELSCEVKAIPEGEPFSLNVSSSTCAAIRVSPCGKYLLASNRANNSEGSVSIIGLDQSGSICGPETIVASGGICPRDFAFNPLGNKIFVANQESDSIDIFDWLDGSMEHCGSFEIQKPACILFNNETTL